MNKKKKETGDKENKRGLRDWFTALDLKSSLGDWKRTSVLYSLIFLAVSLFLFPPMHESREVRYREGDIADSDVIAPFTFTVPYDEREIEINKAKAVVNSPPVYREKSNAEQRLVQDLRDFYSRVSSIAAADSLSDQERLRSLGEIIPDIKVEFLARLLDDATRNRFRRESVKLIESLLEKGILNDASPLRRRNYLHITVVEDSEEKLVRAASLITQDQLEGLILDRAKNIFTDDKELINLFYSITRSFLEPNLVYDREETRVRRDREMEKVPRSFRVSKNQRIIAKHDKITKKQIDVLEAMEEKRARVRMDTSLWSKLLLFFGKALMIMIGLSVFGAALLRFTPELMFDTGKQTMSFIILIFYVLSVAAVLRIPQLNFFAIPIAFVPLIISAFFGSLPAMLFTAFCAVVLVTHTGLPVEPVFIALVTGAAGIISMTHLRERKNFYKVFLYLSLAYIISVVSVGILKSYSSDLFFYNMLLGITSSFISTILVMFLMPIFESLFDLTTDFTLMELSDLNRPLLRRMIIEAPGTYHHSIMVGNMVEAVADDVGANGLLARVAAYYHDIGKLTKPEYFYENKGETVSKHEKLTPSMSALVLASHVKAGVELAKKEKLPKVIVDAIREHHGTSVISFFYNKALEYDSHDAVNIDDFRYQGPKPQSKETAMIMLADASEAAVRSLEEPTAPRIKSLVNKIFEDKMQSGELDDSGLTLNELSLIRERFIQLLTGIFHKRVAYPGQKKETGLKNGGEENKNIKPSAGKG